MAKTKILIVDDDPTLTELTKVILEQNNYETLIADNAREGLRMISKEDPGLIIVDVNLPDMKGPEFFEIQKKDNEMKDIPVIFVSGNDQKDELPQPVKEGKALFLAKPFDANNLLKMIWESLGGEIRS